MNDCEIKLAHKSYVFLMVKSSRSTFIFIIFKYWHNEEKYFSFYWYYYGAPGMISIMIIVHSHFTHLWIKYSPFVSITLMKVNGIPYVAHNLLALPERLVDSVLTGYITNSISPCANGQKFFNNAIEEQTIFTLEKRECTWCGYRITDCCKKKRAS